MINTKDQEALLKVIANNLDEDVECIAFGGTAMMFYKYKTSTKDIDLVFKIQKDRNIFIRAIEKLGYKEKKSLLNIYIEGKREDLNAPKMYMNQDERFDLFAERIFKTTVTKEIAERAEQLQDFFGKHKLRLRILSPEDIVLLKSVTSRERDFDDIQTILSQRKQFNWDAIIDEAKAQAKKGDGWILLDLEETMQKLKDKFFIPEKYFKKLYQSENLTQQI